MTTAEMAANKRNEFVERYTHAMKSNPTMSLGSFHLVCTVGKGSFGRVILSILKSQNKYYAVKVTR
jgi:hypothetical protein